MTKLDDNDIRHLADLARISVNDQEVAKLKKELSSILAYVEQLNKIDTSELKPTSQVTGLVNVSRKDGDFDDAMDRDELLDQVPEVQDGSIKVPKVL